MLDAVTLTGGHMHDFRLESLLGCVAGHWFGGSSWLVVSSHPSSDARQLGRIALGVCKESHDELVVEGFSLGVASKKRVYDPGYFGLIALA
jgi:hypothetical protein